MLLPSTGYFQNYRFHSAPIAQLVEQLPLKEMVAGSNPAGRRMEFYIVEKVTLDAGSNFTRVKFPGTRS